MDRRGFIGGILFAAASPAVVRASSLMPVRNIAIPTVETYAIAAAVGDESSLIALIESRMANAEKTMVEQLSMLYYEPWLPSRDRALS